MTAVANPPSFQQINRSAWGASTGQGLNSMNNDDVARMFMPRKSAQRANSSSSISSASSGSSTGTISPSTVQSNGSASSSETSSWGTTGAARKKAQRTVPWPTPKSEPMASASNARPQSILANTGGSTTSSMSSMNQQQNMVPSQHFMQNPSQQQNGVRGAAQANGEPTAFLYLLSMNGTFERKTITVPFAPEVLRIGRQTNAKTIPTPANGYFDSKVLSRQHAEIWADRNGKIWIRDVKSSNGTFVNGARLSAENRDSEPHELQSQDHLELGIDIVSEDQKTVVHHKVAAKVEHAGYLGVSNNVLDMNFGDLDPANGAMMLPSQGGMQIRGRTGSQGSIGSNGRMMASSVAGSNMAGMVQHRPMNFWLTPVTTEQIVKRLTNELKTCRVQQSELGRTDEFLGTLLSKEEIREAEKLLNGPDSAKPMVNGIQLPFKMDTKPRFSDPPAPPPQQPLPEKPDSARHGPDSPQPSLKRTSTERPRSVPSISPIRQVPTNQIITLVEELANAKKEIESQGSRMRDLEEMLRQEREARESAESLAKRLEQESAGARMNGSAKAGEDSILDATFEPPADENDKLVQEPTTESTSESIEASTARLQQRVELMLAEMNEMKQQMENYKNRAETAEAERDSDRKTLAEMVEKIRQDEKDRHSSMERTISLTNESQTAQGEKATEIIDTIESFLQKKPQEGDATIKGLPDTKTMALSKAPGNDKLLYHSGPYASMLGVVLLGMGFMAYMNGWQKTIDR